MRLVERDDAVEVGTGPGDDLIEPGGVAAVTVPHAAGASRPEAMERSNMAQVAITTSAMIGSGRRPLLYGSQNARKTKAAVQWATLRSATTEPRRGRISRERIHQVRIAASSVGRRIHMDAVVTLDSRARTS